MTSDALAARLLDAQVAWALHRFGDEQLAGVVTQDLADLLRLGEEIRLDEVLDREELQQLVRTALVALPPSTAASTLVAMVVSVLGTGPAGSYAVADLLDRENVERLADEALAGVDLVGRALDDLTRSPLVTSLASRFVTRIVTDVLASNKAMAERIPGVGSLVSFGASAAGKVVGAADKQFEAVLGDTAAKGAAFAMRRLNRIVVETLKDPSTRAAVLEVFDLYAGEEVPPLHRVADQEDLQRIADLLQDIVIAAAPTAPVLALADALVDGFLATYGPHPVTTLVDDLGVGRDQLLSDLTAVGVRALRAARADGRLEALVRERLAPFYSSPEVAAILGE